MARRLCFEHNPPCLGTLKAVAGALFVSGTLNRGHTKAGRLYQSSLSILHKSREVLRGFCVDAWEVPPHPHFNTSTANQSTWHGQGGLPNVLLVTVVLQLNVAVSINHCLKFLYMHYQPVTSLFALIYLESQGQRRILPVFSFNSINITSLLPQLHASQWAGGPQGNSGAFRDTVLVLEGIVQSRVCHQKGSTALPCSQSSPLPRESCTSTGSSPSWCTEAKGTGSLPIKACTLQDRGKREGCFGS